MELSTRDPRRSGMKAAVLARLKGRLKFDAEFSEPGTQEWRIHKARAQLLTELIHEIEALQDV